MFFYTSHLEVDWAYERAGWSQLFCPHLKKCMLGAAITQHKRSPGPSSLLGRAWHHTQPTAALAPSTDPGGTRSRGDEHSGGIRPLQPQDEPLTALSHTALYPGWAVPAPPSPSSQGPQSVQPPHPRSSTPFSPCNKLASQTPLSKLAMCVLWPVTLIQYGLMYRFTSNPQWSLRQKGAELISLRLAATFRSQRQDSSTS